MKRTGPKAIHENANAGAPLGDVKKDDELYYERVSPLENLKFELRVASIGCFFFWKSGSYDET